LRLGFKNLKIKRFKRLFKLLIFKKYHIKGGFRILKPPFD